MLSRSFGSKFLVMALSGIVLAGCASTKTAEPPPPAPAPAAVRTTPPPPPGPTDMGYVTDESGNRVGTTVYFDYDRSIINPDGRSLLVHHARYLRTFSARNALVEGHCDERGTREYNLALGERRANAVREFLMAEGASGAQLDTVTYGEERPVDPGHDESAWSKNRRAELVLRQ